MTYEPPPSPIPIPWLLLLLIGMILASVLIAIVRFVISKGERWRGERRNLKTMIIASIFTVLCLGFVFFTTSMLENVYFNFFTAFLSLASLVALFAWTHDPWSPNKVLVKLGYSTFPWVRVHFYYFSFLGISCFFATLAWTAHLFGAVDLTAPLVPWRVYFQSYSNYYGALGVAYLVHNIVMQVFALILDFLVNTPLIFLGIGVFDTGVMFLLWRQGLIEMRLARTIYKDPARYSPDPRQTGVLLGHEFKRWTLREHVMIKPVQRGEHVMQERTAKKIEVTLGADQPYYLDFTKEVNQHCIITGSSGSGKSQTVKAVVGRYWRRYKIPILFIDWTGEYTDFVKSLGGKTWSVPDEFKINPFELYGFKPSQRAASMAEALMFAVDLTPLQRGEIDKRARELYEKAEIKEDDPSTWNYPPPTIQKLIKHINDMLQSEVAYSKTEREWARWIVMKLQLVISVFGEEAEDFWQVVYSMPTCIDLSRLKSENEKILVTYVVLQRIYESMSELAQLRLITVLDEAWQIFQTKEKDQMVQEPLPTKIVRMGRKYGMGIIVSTQNINDIPQEIISNAATVIVHRFWEPKQLEYIKKFISLADSELESLRNTPPGAGYIRQSSRPNPALVQVQMFNPSDYAGLRVPPRPIPVQYQKPIARTPPPESVQPSRQKTVTSHKPQSQVGPHENHQVEAGGWQKYVDEFNLRTGEAVEKAIDWIRGRRAGDVEPPRAESTPLPRIEVEPEYMREMGLDATLVKCVNCGFESPANWNGRCKFCGRSLYHKEILLHSEVAPHPSEAGKTIEETESLVDWYEIHGWKRPEEERELPPTTEPEKIQTETVVEEVEPAKEDKPLAKEKAPSTPTDEEVENMIEEYIKTNHVGNLGTITEALKPRLTAFASPEDKVWRILKRMEKARRIEHRDVPSFSAPFVRYYAVAKRDWGGNVGIEHVAMTKELLELLKTMNLPVKIRASPVGVFPSFFDVILESWGIIEVETGLKDHLMKSRKDAKQIVKDKIKKMQIEGLRYMVFLASKKTVAKKIREAIGGTENIRVYTVREFLKDFSRFFSSTFKRLERD